MIETLDNTKCPDCGEVGNYFADFVNDKVACNSDECWDNRNESNDYNMNFKNYGL